MIPAGSAGRDGPDVLATMRLQAQTLYVHDKDGRLLSINEAEPARPAPLVFIGRTEAGFLTRFRRDADASILSGVAGLLKRSKPVVDGPDDDLAAALSALLRDAGSEAGAVWDGPAFDFPFHLGADAGTVLIDAGNAELLSPHFSDLPFALVGPCIAVVRSGAAVAVCHSARRTGHAAEAGVFTIPAFRGQGLAPQAVRGWASAVRSLGLTPLYSTSWGNHASRAVARRLGLRQFGADLHGEDI